MIVNVPIDKAFNCPPGPFRGILKSIRFVDNETYKKNAEPQVRFAFEIPSLSTEDTTMLVLKTYINAFDQKSELRKHLESWVGEEFVRQHRKGRTFDLDILLWKPADLVVTNRHTDRYRDPFVTYERIYAPGTLLPLESNHLKEGI